MYTIRTYSPAWDSGGAIVERVLSVSGNFAIACEPMKFRTIGDAAYWCFQNKLRYHKPEWFIQGPRGGRYDSYGIRIFQQS